MADCGGCGAEGQGPVCGPCQVKAAEKAAKAVTSKRENGHKKK